MSERTYYVECADGCLFESLTKEQILAAISSATGNTVGSISTDDAFITKVKELNGGAGLQFSVLTQAEYNELVTNDNVVANCMYIISDETTIEDIASAIEQLQFQMLWVTPKAFFVSNRPNYKAVIDLSGRVDIRDQLTFSYTAGATTPATCSINLPLDNDGNTINPVFPITLFGKAVFTSIGGVSVTDEVPCYLVIGTNGVASLYFFVGGWYDQSFSCNVDVSFSYLYNVGA